MTTRRDNPDGALWRLAVEGFSHILVDDDSRIHLDGQDPNMSRPSRTRLWKEVPDVYEIFLVCSCECALASKVLSSATLNADESLEMTILDVLGDKILNTQSHVLDDILQRLISTLDRCASHTCCLPFDTVELMPSHCSRFDLTCLQKLFSLCRLAVVCSILHYTHEANTWSSARSKVSKISIRVLINRCEYILKKFLIDENDLGEHFTNSRIEEIVYVLIELASGNSF
ncbi:hypothetical protein BVC80_8807g23 [Macleaya cordata]|uniref:Mon2 C-terminal domain-containing protein n=1 Tax=Macleaya cordata TaxID=56857 RepID=A0A200R872_MACCD|nr:hypothetical protein BVC80_8807g23 [Macleaya cordata]